jgi:hypothetical protein
MIRRAVVVLSVLASMATAGLSVPVQAQSDPDAVGIRRVTGSADRPAFVVGGLDPNIRADEITAFAGNRPLNVRAVTHTSSPPTDFLLLIDISPSVRGNADIIQITNILIDRMSSDDRMEIVTFGDSPFTERVALTSNKGQLRTEASRIVPSRGGCTRLYQAMSSAADRLRRRDLDPVSTGRNTVLVVLSDGDDDDPTAGPPRGGRCSSGPNPLRFKAQEDLANAQVPLLFVDTPRDPTQLCRSEFATLIVSRTDRRDRQGGLCVPLGRATDAVRLLTAVTRIETTCSDCPGGLQSSTTYALGIRRGSLSLAREARLELSQEAVRERSEREQQLEADRIARERQLQDDRIKREQQLEDDRIKREQQLEADRIARERQLEAERIARERWFWLLAICFALALVAGAIFLFRFLRPKPRQVPETVAENSGVITTTQSDVKKYFEQDQPKVPAALPNALFVQLGHHGTEQRFQVAITDRPISLGRAADCDIALARDSAVAETQCEFVREDGEVLVRNLAPDRPMLLGGASMLAGADWRRLRHGDVLRVGNTDLRFADLEGTV